MGNAVVSSIFPDIFLQYLIFTLPLWIFIYMWGVPKLLISNSEKKHTFRENIKAFINPMFICMIIGMVIGITKISIPKWMLSIIDTSGNCMSPIAMLLTGIIVSSISLKKTFFNIRIYIVSIIRLIVIPVVFIFVLSFFEMNKTTYICILCSLAMPLGLNTIVIPSALGKDTSVAAGMTLVSHLLSCITIPIIFSII